MKKTGTNFSIVSFDGIHRSGKGTQIALLKQFCEKEGIKTFTFRGEYYRFGSGSDEIEDPHSTWRQENKYADCYKEKTQRLNRELRVTMERILPRKLSHQEKIIIILDRSIAGRFMRNSTTENAEIDPEVFLKFTLGDNSNISHKVIIPDHMVILKPSQDELRKRLFSSKELYLGHEDLLKTYKFDMIENHYYNFYKGLYNMPESIQKELQIIEGDINPNEAHIKIINTIAEKGII